MKSSSPKLSDKTRSLINQLHSELSLNHKNWHKLKNDSDRRALELLIAAIGQISEKGKDSDVISLVEQALKWIKKEIKDPGCPSH